MSCNTNCNNCCDKIFYVLGLPPDPQPNAIYFLYGVGGVSMYVTNKNGEYFLINESSIPTFQHNLLDGLQGGTTGEYYHLTQLQHQQLIAQLTGLISIDNIIQGDGEVTLEGVLWMIEGVQFYVASQTFPINPATDGFYRTDIIAGNSSGILSYVEGIESTSNPVTPTTPPGQVLITRINIFGDTVEIPVDPLVIPTAQQVFEQGRTVNLLNGSPISLLHNDGVEISSLQLFAGGTTQLAGNNTQIFGTDTLDLSLGTSDTVPTTNSGTWNLATNVNGLFANTSGTIDITSLIPLPQGLQSVLDTGETAESNDGLSVITLQPNYFIDGGTQNPFIYFKMSNDDESLYTEYSQNHDGLNIYRYNNTTGLQEFIDFDQFNPMIYMEATDSINGGGSNFAINQQIGIYGGYADGVSINNTFEVTPDGFKLSAGAGGTIQATQADKLVIGGAANGISIQGQGGDVEIQGGAGGIYVTANDGFNQLNGEHNINTASEDVIFELGGGEFIINPITASNFAGIQYAHDNSANYVPLSLVTKQDLDNAVAASYRPAGNWDASVGTFPTVGTGSGGAVRAGDVYRVSVAGTIAGEIYDVGDTFYAVVNAPGQTASNWGKFEVNTSQATDSYRGTMFLYATTGVNTNGTMTQAIITSQLALKAPINNASMTGTFTLPNGALTITGGSNNNYIRGDGSLANFTNGVRDTTIGTNNGLTTQLTTTTSLMNSAWQLQNQINAFPTPTGIIVQNGNTFGTSMRIGTNDNNPVLVEHNNIDILRIQSTGIEIISATKRIGSDNFNGYIEFGASGIASNIYNKSMSSGSNAYHVFVANGSGTGDIVQFRDDTPSVVTVAGVTQAGNMYGADAINSNHYVTLNQTTGFLRLGGDTVQTPHKQSFLTEAQFALITPDLIDTAYFIEEAIPTKIVNLVTNASTYSISYIAKVIYITFNGTTSTFTLPAITGGDRVKITIFNQGSGTVTVNSNTGGNDIWDGSAVNTLAVTAGTNAAFYNNGINFSTLAA